MPLDIPLGTETAGETITIDGRTYRPFLVDASGHLLAIVQAAGGDKPLSLESIVLNQTSNSNLPGGAVNHASGAVPTGKVWKINNISWIYYGTAPALIIMHLLSASVGYDIRQWDGIAQAVRYYYQGELWLPAAAYINLYIANSTLGDSIVLNLVGYQMDAP